jgi:small subunit ribosomal protein S4
MGDPKFPRRRYDTPSHPWKAERIAAEKTVVRKYGLKNKREVWKAQTRLREFRHTARVLLSKQHTPTPQIQKESSELIARLNRIGLLRPGATLDDILGLDVENLLARRLQTVVYLKGLAATPKQSRQFIIHGHVTVGGRRVTVPSYLVPGNEEEAIEINPKSAVADPAHPVRARPEALAAPVEDRPRGGRGGERGGERGGRGEGEAAPPQESES